MYSHTFSPARTASPQIRSTPDIDSQYLKELLAEHQKLGPFVQVLPICSRLLNQEILRLSSVISPQAFGDYDRMHQASPSHMGSGNLLAGVGGMGLSGWNGLLQEQKLGVPQGMTMDWQGAPPSPSSFAVKKILRLEIPVDTYPNFNFVGRLLGPRGNSLKRVEASTGCRVYIRGKGSIKDPGKEDKHRGRPGYEHLNEPLHILIEAELPPSVIDARLRHAQEIIEELLKPVDESQDFLKRQQLRELAYLNSSFREDSPQPSGSVSPFNSSGMKRAKTDCSRSGRQQKNVELLESEDDTCISILVASCKKQRSPVCVKLHRVNNGEAVDYPCKQSSRKSCHFVSIINIKNNPKGAEK